MLLLVDLETTQEMAIEIALVAFDTENKTMVGSFSTLLHAPLAPRTETDAPSIHRISDSAVMNWGIELQLEPETERQKPIYLPEILKLSGQWIEQDFDYIVAHNVSFEQQYIETAIPWLCTYRDFDLFPPNYNAKRDLISLAQWYGVGVSVSHRAIYDCLLMTEIFSRVPDLRGELQYATLPTVEWIAPKTAEHPPIGFRWDYGVQGWTGKQTNGIVGSMFAELGDRQKVIVENGYQNKEAAKEWGFCWDAENKIWHRLINPSHINYLPFPVRAVEQSCEF